MFIRMEEDPSEEWEDEKIYPYPAQGWGNRKLEWLWHKGFRLGKKIAVTGVLISSAPLVLPPVVALSALGIALSVSIGFVFGSYMCTEKLMSRLLSEPKADRFPYLGHKSMCLNEGEEGRFVTEGWYDEIVKDRVAYVESYEVEEEEKELEEDARKGIEMRIELDDVGNMEDDKCKILPADGMNDKDLNVDVPNSLEMQVARGEVKDGDNGNDSDKMEVIDDKIELNRYEEDVGEFMEEEEEQPPIAVDELLTGIREGEGEMPPVEERGNRISVDADEQKHLDPMNEMLIKRIGEAEDVLPLVEQLGIQLPLSAKLDLSLNAVQNISEANGELEGETSPVDQRRELDELSVGGHSIAGDGLLKGNSKEDGMPSLEKRGNEVLAVALEQQALIAVNENEIIKGIREAENEIALMEERGYEAPVDAARAAVLIAESVGKNDGNVEHSEKLASPEPRVFCEKSISTRLKFGDFEPDELVRETTGLQPDELARETIGLLERIRDEGRAVNETPQWESEVSPVVPEGNYPSIGMEELKMVPEEAALDFRGDDGKMVGTAQNGEGMEIPVACVIPDEVMPTAEDGGATLGASVVRNAMTQTWVSGPLTGHGLVSEEQVPGVEKKQVVTSRHIEDVAVHNRKKSFVLSDADVREIADESGFNLFEVQSGVDKQVLVSGEIPEGEDRTSADIVASAEGHHKIPISWGVTKLDVAETVTEKETSVDPNEARIWKQIRALRTVLGYEAAIHSTCAEELKSLYIFTGVGPPDSLNDNSDLADQDEKLQFLMAIVGVKAAPSA